MIKNIFNKQTLIGVFLPFISNIPLDLSAKYYKNEGPPNIIFIYADDWGWGDLGCHGHKEIKTPNLDKLASEGTDFYRFTVGSPVCSPSRATILTGHYPARHSIHTAISTVEKNKQEGNVNWLDPQAVLLPRLLKDAGYATAHFGKWHLSLHGSNITPDTPLPKDYGYDIAAVWTGPGASVWENSSYAAFEGGKAFQPEPSSYLTAAAVEHTIKFITEVRDHPFFVNLCIHETHTYISATEEDRKVYPNTPEPFQTYYAAVSRADRLIGELLNALKKLDLENNTVVIFASDNGPEDQHPDIDHTRYRSVGVTGGLRGQKRSLYLGGVNTPFIVRWPGHVPTGRVDTRSVISGVDMLPTLLEIANISLPAGYQPDGVSVLPALKGEEFLRSKPLFWEWRGPQNMPANWPELAMLDEEWVLLFAEHNKRIELYNVITDREQKTNLISKYPERTQTMLKALQEWKASLPVSTRLIKDPKK